MGVTIDTGIFSLNIAANGTASGLTKLVSWAGASGIVNPHDIAIDSTNNLLFFTDYGDSQDGTAQAFNPRIEVANLTTGAILNANLVHRRSPCGERLPYYFYGIDVDPANHKALLGHRRIPPSPHTTRSSAPPTVPARPAASNVTALFTASSTGTNPTSIAIDVANGVYYAGFGNGTTAHDRRGKPQRAGYPDDDLQPRREPRSRRTSSTSRRRC